MESKNNSFFWKLIYILGAWTLVLSAIQGICIYYFITRHTADKNIAQANFINKKTDKLVAEMEQFPRIDEIKVIEKNVEKIEKDITNLDSKFDEILKKMTDTGTQIGTIQGDALKQLTPDVKIKSKKSFYVSGYQAKIVLAIENKGKYSAKIHNTKLYLSHNKIDLPEKISGANVNLSDKIRNQLTLNNDYYLRTNIHMGDIAPGEEVKRDLTIEFINPPKILGTIYYCIAFDVQTDPNIIKSVKSEDKDKITDKKFHHVLGDIITPG